MKKPKENTKILKSRTPKKKVLSLKKLTIKLDRVCSEYIRRKDVDFQGCTLCVSCGSRKPWKEQQCGHYNKRSARATRWSEKNCYVQCVVCNIFKKGNYPAFTEFILNTYGEAFLKVLIQEGKTIKKFSTIDLQNEIEKYTKLISELST